MASYLPINGVDGRTSFLKYDGVDGESVKKFDGVDGECQDKWIDVLSMSQPLKGEDEFRFTAVDQDGDGDVDGWIVIGDVAEKSSKKGAGYTEVEWTYIEAPDGSSKGELPTEEISLNYEKIQWSYAELDAESAAMIEWVY